MRYTPVELRHVRIGRAAFGGLKRRETEQLIEDIAESFEDVWRERGELTDKLEDVERRFDALKARESLLASTLVSAERAAMDAKEAAKREAELIIAEAHQEARSVTRAGQGERERLFAEVRRIETLLRAALGLVEETRSELPLDPLAGLPPAAPAGLAAAPDHWPKRQDTREFEAVSAPEPEVEPVLQEEAEPESLPEAPVPVLPVLPPVTSVDAEPEDDGPWAGRDFAWG